MAEDGKGHSEIAGVFLEFPAVLHIIKGIRSMWEGECCV